jgi:endo-1,4-beta-xylanase
VNAMKMAGVEITGQQIIEALNDQNYFQVKNGLASNYYLQFRYKVVDEKGTNYSIAFNYSPENGWVLSTLKELGMMYNLEFGAHGIARRIGAIRIYNETLASNYNLVMSEGEFRIETVKPTKDSPYNFTKGDSIVKFAEANGMKIQAHHLVRDEMRHYPEWLTNGSLSQQELQQVLIDYITQTVGYFNGQVQQWSVINEPFDGNNNPWIMAFGREKYMQVAFDAARSADPNAILLLNERLMETESQRVNYILKIVSNLNSEKHRVDGVGFQLDIDGSRPLTEEQITGAMKKFTDAGITVYITELEVDMTKVSGSDIDKQKRQAQIYAEIFRACIEARCKSFTTFGFSDSVSSLGDGDESLEAAPLLFDENFQPKPSLYALLNEVLNITIDQ